MEEALKMEYFLKILHRDEKGTLQEFVRFLETGSSARNYHSQEKIVNLVTKLPYPCVQILQGSEKKVIHQIEKLITKAFQLLLSDETTSLQMINVLANFPQSILESPTFWRKDLLITLISKSLDNKIFLALLSRKETTLLNDVLNHLKKCWQNFDCETSKEFVFSQAYERKLHFVPLIIEQKNFMYNDLCDTQVRNNLLILKIVNTLSNTDQTLCELGNIAGWLREFVAANDQDELLEIQKFLYADFQSICLILQFLKKNSESYKTITIGELLNVGGIMELVYNHKIASSFENTRTLIECVYKWQLQIPAMKCVHELELETLTYYGALTTVIDIVLSENTTNLEQYCTSKMHQLNSTFRQIRNIDKLNSLIEDIIQLVFLRWEHILSGLTSTGMCNIAKKQNKSSRSSSSDNLSDPMMTKAISRNEQIVRQGFVCKGQALFMLFSFLKQFTTKKLHSDDYKHASERTQMRFQRNVDNIGEALWKYSVIEKIDDSLARCGTIQIYPLEAEDLLQLIKLHVSATDKSSSDDDSRDRNFTSLARRKAARKYRRATFSGAAISRPHNLEQFRVRGNLMSTSVDAQGAKTDRLSQFKTKKLLTNLVNRSIIPKMLGSPESLAVMALSLQNFNDVKYIIETFNLQNTELTRELSFNEQQQSVREKLFNINTSYQQQEKSSNNSCEPKATVEQIRSVAAKGFEVSKIINVVDNFAQSQKVQQSIELKQLLLKYSTNPQYVFLHQFEERNLNAVIIADLVLNLPFNREITSNVLSVIKRQQQIAASIVKNFKEDATIKSQFKDIGAMHLLENLCECMRVMDSSSLSELLYDNYYSLKPRNVELELEREKVFAKIFYACVSQSGYLEDMKMKASLFTSLRSKNNYFLRFCNYVTYLIKLLQVRDNNVRYRVSELLKMDPYDIIGQLIIECNMTPLEIETNVTALNLNLVHVIALNICPMINATGCKIPKRLPPQKMETIFNYISNQNSLLAYLLQEINKTPILSKNENINPVFLDRFVQLPELATLIGLYDNNALIAALSSDNWIKKNWKDLSLKRKLDLLRLHLGNCEPRTKLHRRMDEIVIELIKEDTKNIYLANHIHDIAVRAKLIQENFTKISTTRLAKDLIESTLQHKTAMINIPPDLCKQLEYTFADITVYAKVSEVLQFETWPQAYDFGLKTPNSIFEKLLQLHLYKLCYKWCKVVKLAERFVQQKPLFFGALLKSFLELNDDQAPSAEVNKYLLQILEIFPVADCVVFLDSHKDKFRSLLLMHYAIDFLSKNVQDCSNIYRNYNASLVIFQQLTAAEREFFWNLFKFPLLIIEQLIMNAKFETLTQVLKAVRKFLHYDCTRYHNAMQLCSFCFDKSGNIYDIHIKGSHSQHMGNFQLGIDGTNSANSAFILLNFNLYQKDHIITNDCIDLLLRIYATKALDYHISDTNSSSEHISHTTDMQQSLDSLCGAFQMPKIAPPRDDWIRDDDATHCMCCRRTAFTMFMRRHHCRRCGRVVCFSCSSNRMRIPELYADVEVRICNDCHRIRDETQRKSVRSPFEDTDQDPNYARKHRLKEVFKWKLSGNITHDKLMREEFCYEHAPSVALCLSILGYHMGQQKCVDLLLYHCKKLEKLIIPNPEVDYELIAKMMNCLALAAKVRGGPPEIETIREHSEIIMSVVQNGCESLLPSGPLNNHNIRKLADSLVQAEKWQLALEVHLKCGFPTAGVMAAHGLACLRAGCLDTAREKFSHCMSKLSNELTNKRIVQFIMNPNFCSGDSCDIKDVDIPCIKRPQRGPPLLQEICKIIESIPSIRPQAETLQRASIIRNSNSSIVSLLSRRKEAYVIPMHEPALHVLNTLANLKRISKGQYTEKSVDQMENFIEYFRKSHAFEECINYVLTYGSHTDILKFLMRHQHLTAALRYFLVQNLEAELFIQNIFLVCLRCGSVQKLINEMLECDSRLVIWRNTLIYTCRYLEIHNHLNSLYQLQILLKDPVRASMTCVKFYSMNCENFQQLYANAQHLQNAHRHLQSELEIAQWENISLESIPKDKNTPRNRRPSATSTTPSLGGAGFLMQMDARSLNCHINTILKQLDVTKFLAICEKENSSKDGLITLTFLKQIRLETGKTLLPTLFDSVQDKIEICILILLCGKNIEEGFGLAYRVIQDYKLQSMKVFAATAKYLARNHRLPEVEKLLNCITTNNGTTPREIDEILSIAIHSATNSHESEVKTALDSLVKKIHSVELRISCHIFIGQLKSAYLLANKHERTMDIRKILRQAELTNQVHIKKLCEKKLNTNFSQGE